MDSDGAESQFKTPPETEDEIYIELSQQQIKLIPRRAIEYVYISMY